MILQATPTYHRTSEVKDRIVVFRGGARSGKSFAMIQKIAIWLYTGQISGGYVAVGSFTAIRLTFPALRTTVYREFIDYLFQVDWYKYIDHRKSIHEFHYGKRFVSFTPADDPQKLRGRKHTFVLFEECNDVDFESFNQVEMRTDKQIFLTTNPSGHPWVRTEIEDKRMDLINDVYLDISTYKDNPFLDKNIVNTIENLKYTDKALYEIYALGAWTELKGVIFPNFEIVKKIPTGKIFFGVDFGWNSPTAAVKVTLSGDNMYIESIIHEREMTLDAMAIMLLKECGHSKVYCDSAEPRSIYELKKRGVNAKSAKKGRDSIRQGLTFMRQHKIHVHEEAVDCIDEFRKYKWQENSDGVILDKPIDQFDHCADACRYAISSALGSKIKLI